MKKNTKTIPNFKNEDEERSYWEKQDLSKNFTKNDFINVSFPDLKPTSRSISIRIPENLLIRIKEQANELNIPYQSLIKKYLAKEAYKK